MDNLACTSSSTETAAFTGIPPASMEARLTSEIDLAGFRSEAQQLLAHQVPPDSVRWQTERDGADPFAEPAPASASRPRAIARAATAIVPASFVRLCESVVLHKDNDRFALLYRLLWRLVHEPALRNDPVDPDMLRAQHMAHAVRRDMHKMKAYVRFVPAGEGLQAAWFEPSHHIVEAVAPWFAKRHTAGPWVIFTPERSVRFDGERLLYGPGLAKDKLPPEGDAAGWLRCVREVFEPFGDAA